MSKRVDEILSLIDEVLEEDKCGLCKKPQDGRVTCRNTLCDNHGDT